MINNDYEQDVFAYDIETIPNMSIVHLLPEPEVKYGNVKNPELKKAKLDEAKAKQIGGMALSPFFGRICCFAVHGNKMSRYTVMEKISDETERELIKDIFSLFANKKEYQPMIITWAGKDEFDMRFLYTRAAILSVQTPVGVPSYEVMCKKFENENHIDLMTVLCGWGNRFKLDIAAQIFFGEKKLKHDFSKFIELIETGRGDEIGRYNLKDAELTYELYKRVQPLFLGV